MQIFDKLPQEDLDLLHAYLDEYSDGPALPRGDMDYFLRYWDEAKANFYHMFGDQFIIKQEVAFERPEEEMESEMFSILYSKCSNEVRSFINNYKQKITDSFSDYETRYELIRFVDNEKMLVTNVYNGPSITIPAHLTIDGHPLQINSGCKTIKMLGKIAKALDVTKGYEEFRQAHSLVLNQKRIKGNLCLSIHPLDFLTMSDNECGWGSCMSWVDEYGDFRLGTIEMMNSPYVVIAYVEAKNPMDLCYSTWNNKRWRQLCVVTPDLILGNKQYPYSNDVLQGCTLKWLRELCGKSFGYGPYAAEANQIRNGAWNRISGKDRPVHINLTFDYMYNDIYDTRLAYANPNIIDMYSLNLSGPAVCTGCGNIIEYDTVEAHIVRCRSCDGMWQCDRCGEWHSGEPWYGADDCKCYCDWCYNHELDICECCGDRGEDFTHVYFRIITAPEEQFHPMNWSYYVALCDCCFDDPDEYEPTYGPLIKIKDEYGGFRYVFDLSNITDDGLKRGDLSRETIDSLKRIRDARSDKKRLKLIQELLI